MANLDLNQAFGTGGLTLNSSPGLYYNSQPTGQAANAAYNVGIGNTGPSQLGSVLGTSTSGGGVSSFTPGGGVTPDGSYSAGYHGSPSAEEAARAAAAAALQEANTAYDYNAATLNNQLGALGNQKEAAINELDTGLSGVRTQIGTSRTNAQTNNEQQVQQAGSVAHSTQQQNRNVLRSLGILNSTAAGELLSKPINEFDKQRATLNTALGQRFGELDDFLNQKVAEANNAKNSIISQFTDLTGKINTDLRFNERQRIDAVKSANAALQQRLADIQQNVLNYQQQVQTQKQNFAQGLASIIAQQDPTYAKQAFTDLQLSSPNNQVNTVGIAPGQLTDEQKRKQGLLAG